MPTGARGWVTPNQPARLRTLRAQQLLVPSAVLEEDWGWLGFATPQKWWSQGRGKHGVAVCAECGSKACSSLMSLRWHHSCMGLPLSDRLHVPPMQAGHRPLCHTVLSQHTTRALRDETRGTGAESAMATLPCCKFTAASPGQMGPLAAFAMPMAATGQESWRQAPIPGQQWSHRWDEGQVIPPSIYASAMAVGVCPCSVTSSLGWEDPESPGSQPPSGMGAPWHPPCYEQHYMTPSPSSPPCPMGSSLSSTAPSPHPSNAASSPCPSLTSGAPAALSLLAGEMLEVSLGTVAGSICSSVVQLMPPAPGSRMCCVSISLTVPALGLPLGENQLVTACNSLLASPARDTGTAGMDGGKHPAAETSRLGCLQPGHGLETPSGCASLTMLPAGWLLLPHSREVRDAHSTKTRWIRCSRLAP